MTPTGENYLHLANLAAAAALDQNLWQEFLDEAATIQGTNICAQLIGYDLLNSTAPLAFATGYDPEILELYTTHYASSNPYAARFPNCRMGEVISVEALCPAQEIKKTEFYADLLHPMESIVAGGGALLVKDDTRMFLLGGNIREKDRDKFEEGWLQLCSQLAPVVRQSLEISRILAGKSFEKWMSDRHLLGTGAAVLVVDMSMKVRYACEQAEDLLQRGGLIRTGLGEKLQFLNEDAQALMSAFIRRQGDNGDGPIKSLRLQGERGDAWTCRAVRVDLGQLKLEPLNLFVPDQTPAIALAFKLDQTSVSLSSELQKKFGFSPAETETVLLLSDGKSTAQIAKSRNISIHTARNQIKAALAKSGSSRQSELVKKVEEVRYRQI